MTSIETAAGYCSGCPRLFSWSVSIPSGGAERRPAPSQEALADRAGLHRTYISLLERGLRNPSLTVISKLAKALDARMSALMSELEGT